MDRYKVLVVEDDEMAKGVLARAVTKEGFEVITAEDGRIGLEIFKEKSPQIVITDLKMPEIGGIEVMHAVRKLSPDTQVILVTAFGETDTAIMALREGALDYIKKPLDLDILSVALGRAKEKISEFAKVYPYPTLLLAEDDETTRTRLADVIETDGMKVYKAADGEEAVKLFQQNKIDIVLVDIKMPRKDGLQALRDMREITDDFEAIILTSYGDESSAIKAMRAGAINFLKKPIDLDELVVVVEKAMEKLGLRRSLKYRSRELELSRQLMAQITTDNEIIVDISEEIQTTARTFAQCLLNAIPMELAVLDKDLTIRYANRQLAKVSEMPLGKFDDKFVKDLEKIGIVNLSYETMISTINTVMESPMGTLETVRVGKYAFILLTPITIVNKDDRETVVLMALRGERK